VVRSFRIYKPSFPSRKMWKTELQINKIARTNYAIWFLRREKTRKNKRGSGKGTSAKNKVKCYNKEVLGRYHDVTSIDPTAELSESESGTYCQRARPRQLSLIHVWSSRSVALPILLVTSLNTLRVFYWTLTVLLPTGRRGQRLPCAQKSQQTFQRYIWRCTWCWSWKLYHSCADWQ
jgi:hypothetical protein